MDDRPVSYESSSYTFYKGISTDRVVLTLDTVYNFDSETNSIDTFYVRDENDTVLKTEPYETVNRINEKDTLYTTDNEFAYNIYAFFYRKSRLKDRTLIPELSSEARIPIFDADAFNNQKPLSGEISYSIFTDDWEVFLLHDTIEIEFYIYDFKLNKSNVALSDPFVLKDITE